MIPYIHINRVDSLQQLYFLTYFINNELYTSAFCIENGFLDITMVLILYKNKCTILLIMLKRVHMKKHKV